MLASRLLIFCVDFYVQLEEVLLSQAAENAATARRPLAFLQCEFTVAFLQCAFIVAFPQCAFTVAATTRPRRVHPFSKTLRTAAASFSC